MVTNELMNLVHEAVKLEKQLERWMSDYPASYHPRELKDEGSGTRTLIYENSMISVAWNMYRCNRIMLHEMRLRCELALGDHKWACCTKDTHNAADLVKTLTNDILDSIPFCLSDVDSNGESRTESFRPSRSAAGYLLLWPLLVFKLGSYTTMEQRDRATATLERIGSKLGIKQALQLL